MRAGIIAAKEIIYDGFVEAVRRGVPVEAAGVLTDEQYGAGVARRAKVDGHLLAMPVERSGQLEFEFETARTSASTSRRSTLRSSRCWCVTTPRAMLTSTARQTERLARLASWLHERRRLFLFELLVPATPGQLDAAGEDQRRYDREVRPGLVVRTIEALQAGAVEPDIWKIEGLDEAAACAQVVAARAGGRDGGGCIVLGRGADEAQVMEWFRVAAAVPGFEGFAVGRTIREEALRSFIAGKAERGATVEQTASALETFNGFTGSP